MQSIETSSQPLLVSCSLFFFIPYAKKREAELTHSKEPLRNLYQLLFPAVRKNIRRILTGVYNIQKVIFFSLAIFGGMLTLQGFPANIIILKEVFVKLSTETGEEKSK